MLGFSYMTYHTTEAPQVKLQIALNRGFDFSFTGSNYLSNLCVSVCVCVVVRVGITQEFPRSARSVHMQFITM